MPKITLENGKTIEISTESYNKLKEAVKGLPDRWEDINKVAGWYVKSDSNISRFILSDGSEYDKNMWATKELAEASLAMSQLSQLRKIAWDSYDEGWEPEWGYDTIKYSIVFFNNVIVGYTYCNESHFLSFPTAELREEFLKKYRDLIETAKPLL